MDEYLKLFNLINYYLSSDDIVDSNEFVSVYSLIQIIKEELERLCEITVNHTFKNKINDDSKSKNKFMFLNKKEKEEKDKCSGIYYYGFDNTSEIGMCLDTGYVRVSKDRNCDEIYFGYISNNSDKEYVAKYYDDIMNYFSILEDFIYFTDCHIIDNKFYEKNVCTVLPEQKIFDSLFDVSLSVNENVKLEIYISINKEIDSSYIYNREWFKRVKLSDYVNENKLDILKKIPVEVSSLNEPFRKMVEKKNKNKVLAK